ncbi:MAG: acriflavine resistance protein B [Rhodobacterales bacterium]|nr:MAG: acriflavine resistance protein B [Rhodobacterales bacterium]
MIRVIDWAAERARMVMAFVLLTLIAGVTAYVGLPKEGQPDIEIPAIFVSVPFPGISAADSERLLVQPMEAELADIDGLKSMSGTAAEGYAGVALEFEFGWDRSKVIADVRDAMNKVETKFPEGAKNYSVNEINFAEFPILIVNLTGDVPERTLVRLAQELEEKVAGIDAVLDASLTGYRDEMLEVLIDPLKLEAYNVTAGELINVVRNNNQLIAAGAISTPTGETAVKIPSSFDEVGDVFALPVKVNGDRVVTLGDIAEIRLAFEDRHGTARFNGETTVALQVVKAKGFNIIDTAAEVRRVVEETRAAWPEALQQTVNVSFSNDDSYQVESMVKQLEGSVITAIALVMIVVLASLGMRSALLVGFAIPTSFLLTFVLFGALDYTVSNIVMFGLILAVGILVDGAIVVVEYADNRIRDGIGPMHAYTDAAKRMFWPIVSSTATTLCAFMPMLFWPGVPGEFMGMLPRTLIYVLSASLLVALVYLPVVGGVAGRLSRALDHTSEVLRPLPIWLRAGLLIPATLFTFAAAMQMINPNYLWTTAPDTPALLAALPGMVLLVLGLVILTLLLDSVKPHRAPQKVEGHRKRTPFGHLIHFIAANPVMPFVTILAVLGFVVGTFVYYAQNNNGVTFFADVEAQRGIVYVQARGNLSIEEKDALVRRVEREVLATPGILNVFAFAGEGGLNQNTAGASGPQDQIGQIQIEFEVWENIPFVEEDAWFLGLIPYKKRTADATYVASTAIDALKARMAEIPGIRTEVLAISGGPASTKPISLRLKGDDWDDLLEATALTRAHFDATPALIQIEDSRPLPGIDWELTVDVEAAGRYGTNVATVGGIVQLITNGILLDTMRVESSDEEIEIRVRLPKEDRVLSTLDSLKLRTPQGLVPLSNFVSRKAVPTLAQISRIDQKRVFNIKAAVEDDLVRLTDADSDLDLILSTAEADAYIADHPEQTLTRTVITASERIERLDEWLQTNPLPASVSYEWAGDAEEQSESSAFLVQAFSAALFLMFIILLAQFNSLYNSALVLLAVVLSTAGVLVGMLVMGQQFSIIMTGTGIVALAGIVVNNNIVLIDTYQEYARVMPRVEAIVRTAENRIRPVLLTTITTMAGLTPMMFGLSLDFINGGYSIDAPTALWWKQLATAVVFGLGIATVLTLVFTPSMLALRFWLTTGAYSSVRRFKALASSATARDLELNRAARKARFEDLIWDVEPDAETEADEGAETPEPEAVETLLKQRMAEAETADVDATSDDAPAEDASKDNTAQDDRGSPIKAAE